jgi:hypothetical protein
MGFQSQIKEKTTIEHRSEQQISGTYQGQQQQQTDPPTSYLPLPHQ